MSPAARERQRKERGPEKFCPDHRCLWRLSSGRCPKHAPRPDVRVEGGGIVYLVRPLTERASAWLREHTDPDASTWFAGALACEHRYVADLVAGMELDGLSVRGAA